MLPSCCPFMQHANQLICHKPQRTVSWSDWVGVAWRMGACRLPRWLSNGCHHLPSVVASSCCQLVAVTVNRASNHWAAAAAEVGKGGRTELVLEQVGWGTRDGYGYRKLAAAACYPVLPGAQRRCCQLIDFSLQRASLETGSQSWCRCQCVWPHLLIFFVAHLPAGVISINKDLSACANKLCVCGGLTSKGSSSNSSCGSCGQFTLWRRVAGHDTLSIEVLLMP